MLKQVYMVGRMSKTIGVQMPHGVIDVACTWAQGMLGALPVFDTHAEAEKYLIDCGANEAQYPIIELTVDTPDLH